MFDSVPSDPQQPPASDSPSSSAPSVFGSVSVSTPASVSVSESVSMGSVSVSTGVSPVSADSAESAESPVSPVSGVGASHARTEIPPVSWTQALSSGVPAAHPSVAHTISTHIRSVSRPAL